MGLIYLAAASRRAALALIVLAALVLVAITSRACAAQRDRSIAELTERAR